MELWIHVESLALGRDCGLRGDDLVILVWTLYPFILLVVSVVESIHCSSHLKEASGWISNDLSSSENSSCGRLRINLKLIETMICRCVTLRMKFVKIGCFSAYFHRPID